MSVFEQSSLWTAHIHAEDVPFVCTGVPGMEARLLHYREDEEMDAIQLRAAPFTVSGKHLHLGPAHAYTIAGRWGHDHNYEYVEGTYIFEPIGVVHQFFSGPETVDAFFIAYGDSQWIDEETGEVGGSLGVKARVEHYFEQCEEHGLSRPNILRV
jgi:quercetin dioxygenase-like cupin family protein